VPDLLTHYLSSYLVAQALVKRRHAILIAFAGLLADLDALLRIHRWATHSLVTLLAVSTPLLLLLYTYRREYLKIAMLALLLYTLHIALDIFTAPTPALWPLAPSLWLRVEVNGASTTSGIAVTPTITATIKPVDFTQREAVEGPIISETGLALAITTAILTAAQNLANKRRNPSKRAEALCSCH